MVYATFWVASIRSGSSSTAGENVMTSTFPLAGHVGFLPSSHVPAAFSSAAGISVPYEMVLSYRNATVTCPFVLRLRYTFQSSMTGSGWEVSSEHQPIVAKATAQSAPSIRIFICFIVLRLYCYQGSTPPPVCLISSSPTVPTIG